MSQRRSGAGQNGTRKPRSTRRGLGRVPQNASDLFKLASTSAFLVAQGKMTAVEGKAVADLVNRAGQLAKRLAPAAPTVSAEEAKRMPLEELLVTVRDLAAKLQPGATEPVVDPKASPESVPDLSAEPAAGPGVARVLELLQREEPAA